MRPLSRAAVAELARGSHVDLDALFERTGGNAFYVTEVLAGGDGAVPPTVRDAVLARAARLSAAAREVLAAAAVIGFHAEIDVLAAVSGQPLTALDECLAAGVLRDGGTEAVFRHELAREAVAASTLPGRRRALHRAAYDAHTRLGETRRPAARAPRRLRGRRPERDRPRAAGRHARRGPRRPPGGGRALPRRPAVGASPGRRRPRRPAGTAVLRVLPHGAAAGGVRRPRGRARAAPRERRHAPHRLRPALAVARVLVPAPQRRGRAVRAGGRRHAVPAPGRHGARDGLQQHGPAADARRRHRRRSRSGGTGPSNWPARSATSTPRSTR